MLKGKSKYHVSLSDLDDSSDEDIPIPKFDEPRQQTRLASPPPGPSEPEIKPLRDLEDGKKKRAIRAPVPKLDAEV